MKAVDFYFDIGSPAAYLAWTQMPKVTAETGATVNAIPFLLGGVFKATGNASPVTIPAKGKWLTGDLALWAHEYGLPALNMPPVFPVNTLPFMRAAVAMQMKEPTRFAPLVDALYAGMFRDGLDMTDLQVVGGVLAKAGFDPMAVMALTNEPEVKAKLVANTEEAVRRGAFGAPTFFVGDQLFWGQDRLGFVRRALANSAM